MWWPRNEGHVLVVPTEHVENIYDMPGELAASVHETARKVAIAFMETYGCDGTSTRQHNEPGGNQEVWHFHVHVFPRYEGDGLYGAHAETDHTRRAAPVRGASARLVRVPMSVVVRRATVDDVATLVDLRFAFVTEFAPDEGNDDAARASVAEYLERAVASEEFLAWLVLEGDDGRRHGRDGRLRADDAQQGGRRRLRGVHPERVHAARAPPARSRASG